MKRIAILLGLVATIAYAQSTKPAFQTKYIVIGTDGTPANNIKLHRGANGLQFVPGDDATAEGADSPAAAQLGNDVIDSDQIVSGAVGTDEVENGSILGSDLSSNTVTANEIAGDAVGASELANNAVAPENMLETTDGSSPGAGEIGERISSTAGAAFFPTAGGSYEDIGLSVTVTAGRWRIYYRVKVTSSRFASDGSALCYGVMTDNANVVVAGTYDVVGSSGTNANLLIHGYVHAEAYVSVSSSTTYKVRAKNLVSGSSCSFEDNSGDDTRIMVAERLL